jgi:hypothetical protein
MWKGLLLKESLHDLGVLADLCITRTEVWQVENAAENQPSTWTALSFEAEEAQAERLAEALSQALLPQGWYIDAASAEEVYVIFPQKVFKYRKGDGAARGAARGAGRGAARGAAREAAKQCGRTVGIPETQLDWREE